MCGFVVPTDAPVRRSALHLLLGDLVKFCDHVDHPETDKLRVLPEIEESNPGRQS